MIDSRRQQREIMSMVIQTARCISLTYWFKHVQEIESVHDRELVTVMVSDWIDIEVRLSDFCCPNEEVEQLHSQRQPSH